MVFSLRAGYGALLSRVNFVLYSLYIIVTFLTGTAVALAVVVVWGPNHALTRRAAISVAAIVHAVAPIARLKRRRTYVYVVFD